MYRRYTITGTNNDSSKVRKGLAVFFGLLLVLLIRFWFLCTGQMSVLDDYGYYQASMIQAGDMTPVLHRVRPLPTREAFRQSCGLRETEWM